MPRIDDPKAKRPFKKKSYRPWNLLGTPSDSSDSREQPPKINALENREQTENKKGTNREQTGNKQGTDPSVNGEQTGSKEATVPCFENKRGTEQGTEERANREQTGNKQGTKYDHFQLRGHEQNLLLFIFNECRLSGELLTPPLTLEQIALELKSTKQTAKTVIARLCRKKITSRKSSATGRGGFSRFQLEKSTYQELLFRHPDAKQGTNREQTGNKEGTKRGTERGTTLSSSSSSDLDLKTTTASERDEALPEAWKAIDVTQLSAISFTQTHVRQLHRAGLLTAEELQDSIHAFAFDLEVNGKAKKLNGSPLNFFMGCLRKGPYAPPENFEPPEIRQRRLYFEAKEKAAKARRELEEKLEALEFDEWLSKLSLVERTQLVPASEFAKPGSTAHNVELRRHFREQVWPMRDQRTEALK